MKISAAVQTELKLLVTFLLVYLLFAKWEGWNEQSRFALAESIALRNSLDIDPYANSTGDRSVYEGHYYSDKAPGASILAAPLISTVSGIAGGQPPPQPPFIENVQFNATVYTPLHVSYVESAERLLCILFLSALPGALLVVLIYKTSLLLTKDGAQSLAVAVSFGLGSLILPYSTVFMGNVFAAFVSFLGFYVMMKHVGDSDGRKQMLLAGALIAFASSVDYLSLLAAAGGVAFMLMKRAKHGVLVWLFLGMAVGVLPLVSYNTAIFSSPLSFASSYIDPAIASCYIGSLASCQTAGVDIFQGATPELPMSIAKMLVLPYRGLMFYTPFLLAAIAGFYWLHRSDAALSKSLMLTAMMFVLFIAYYTYWFGGATFGLRYTFAYVPFLSFPIAAFLRRFWHNNVVKAAFMLLVAVSVFHSFLAFSAPWEGFGVRFNEGRMVASVLWDPNFSTNCTPFCTAANFLNPLYDYYLPAFLKNGAVSRILVGMLSGKLDLSHTLPTSVGNIVIATTPAGFAVYEAKYAPLAITTFAFAVAFGAELSSVRVWRVSARNLLFAAGALAVISSLSMSTRAYDNGWYATSADGYMRLESIANMRFLSVGGSYFLNVSADNRESKKVDVYLNGEFVDSFTVHDALLRLADVRKGENVLTFTLAEPCEAQLCLGVGNVTFITEDDLISAIKTSGNGYAFGNNWYNSEKTNSTESAILRWMSQDATIFLPRASTKVKLNISMGTYPTAGTVEVYVNEEFIDSYEIDTFFHTIMTPEIELNESMNMLRLHSIEGCKIHANEGNSSDSRCISLALYEMSEISAKDLASLGETIIFGNGWFEKTHDENWSGENSEMFIMSDKSEISMLTLSIMSYHAPKTLTVYVNENKVGSYAVGNNLRFFNTGYFYLNEGENLVRFSISGCEVPMVVEGTNDARCLGFMLKNITFNAPPFAYESSFSEERLKEVPSIGFGTFGRFYFSNDKTSLRRLSIDSWAPETHRAITLRIDGASMQAIFVNDSSMKFESPLVYLTEGPHILEFNVSGCNYLGKENFCLGAVVGNFSNRAASDLLSNINPELDKGWHELEIYNTTRKFRWSDGDATLSFFNPQSTVSGLNVSFSAWSYFKPRTFSLEFNWKALNRTYFQSENKFSEIMNLMPGSNKIIFHSDVCDVPAEVEGYKDNRCLSVAIVNLVAKATT